MKHKKISIYIEYQEKCLEIQCGVSGINWCGDFWSPPERKEIEIEKVYFDDRDITEVIERHAKMYHTIDIWEHIRLKVDDNV